ncbi:MAG: leucine-rich repeat domain-containing protein [Prevotella sp.]|nr:leucine-rich repeat domain-containing protein [Prevotella sp.]
MKKRVLLYFAMAALMAMPQQMMADDIVINETNFPDENFRNWMLAQDYGQDGVLTETEIAGVTEMDVNNENIANLKGIEYFTALTSLYCYGNQLSSLDVSQNTALTELSCNGNQLSSLDVSQNTALTELSCWSCQLTSLDVSQNTALTYLDCGFNQLTSLDVSQNTALTYLDCGFNQLTSLDVSQNTALTELSCGSNQLTSLEVSQNTALTELSCFSNQLTSLNVSRNTALYGLWCYNNQLTSLDVSQNTALLQLTCYNNRIDETEMGNLVESLPTTIGSFVVKRLNNANEQNVITAAQVAVARAKGWTVYADDEKNDGNWVEYDGDEPTMDPIDTADFGSDIGEGTDLDGNVVGDVFYSISSGDGSYDPAEGCIVVTKPTDDSAIDGKDIFGEDFKAGYTGVVFKVAPGKGSVKVEAQTEGNMVLKVKIGDNDPIEMELEGRLKVSFPYNVSEDTFVYIYGGTNAAGARGIRKATGTGALKIYGIEVTSGTDGIKDIKNERLKMKDSPVYNLNGQRVISSPSGRPGGVPTKGVYIINGKKVVVK